ncbi:MAG TPA: formylmethanofuran dehydrogenase [Methanophagales archaeon]|nr:formylmethanofuran dehydrogenase [Methanophagales archaeon]
MKGRGEKDPFRKNIEELIEIGDLEGLREKTAELHGHFCVYSACGVKAGYIAMRELMIKDTGMKDFVAIVETNNCFSDGIQVVTGCTFGNRTLIFKDYGKTAVTVARRDGVAIRIALNPDFVDSLTEKYPEAWSLFEKIVVRREKATEEEMGRLRQLFTEMSFEMLDVPEDEMFRTERKMIRLPEYAPISHPVFTSTKCSVCGENVLETHARVKGGKAVCIPCSGEE